MAPMRSILLSRDRAGLRSHGICWTSTGPWSSYAGSARRTRTRRSSPTPTTTPRDSGAGPGQGPWLFPALRAYGIPEDHWIPLAHNFIDRLADDVILQAGIPNFHVTDTRGTLEPAGTDDDGATADWENEIHPTADGYDKLAVKVVDKIAEVLNIP
ncbi:hypothetical protein CS8_045330 [Cupriavidus sp. 8B]